LAALSVVIHNNLEDKNAEKVSKIMLQDVQKKIIEHSVIKDSVEPPSDSKKTDKTENTNSIPMDQIEDEHEEAESFDENKSEEESSNENISDESDSEPIRDENIDVLSPQMMTTPINGYDCVGILSIPVLELELPVLTDWSYEKLKISPCLYYGSCYEKDFVIAGHNYRSHFGKLGLLQPNDLVLFTDMYGKVHAYEVVLIETLPANATKEMLTSGFDLSLYTCTMSGTSRTTVRCITKNTH